MTGYVTAADAAKLVRRSLKAAFPGSRFRVTKDAFAGGTAVTVEWTDGPALDAVETVVSPFGAHVSYLHCQRDYSAAAYADAAAAVEARYNEPVERVARTFGDVPANIIGKAAQGMTWPPA